MSKDTAASLATFMIAGLALFLLVLLVTTAAPANSVCLTKKEARHLWPRQHIYWYSKDHCWSNRHGPPRGLKFDPLFSSKAVATSRAQAAEEFNELDAMADKPPI